MYATDRRQTSDRQTSDAHHRVLPPTLGAGHNKETHEDTCKDYLSNAKTSGNKVIFQRN